MTEVINLEEFKHSKVPHMTGLGECMTCKNQWIATAPVGTLWLDCWKCRSGKGFFKFPVETNGQHWQCLCGNFLFYITPDGAYCPNCGTPQNIPF